MSIIDRIKDRWNTRKSFKAYRKISKALTSGNRQIILYLSTDKGYDVLFQKLAADDYSWKIDGNYREGIFLTVERRM